MKTLENFKEGIKKEVPIPDMVNERFEETLGNLQTKPRQGQILKKRAMTWKIASAAAASFVLVSAVLLTCNPSFASKIPVIGTIFSKVEDKVVYSGHYDKSQPLSVTETADTVLSAESRDIKITASEVYSDGFSVYITMRMESDQYDFSSLYTLASTGGSSVNMMTSFAFNNRPGKCDHDITLQGKNQGAHAYVGMAKFDKADYSVEAGFISININEIYLDAQDKAIKGDWRLQIPYETEPGDSKEIPVKKSAADGFTVEKLVISPYQLVVLSSGLAEEEYYEIAVFDQNGKRLEFEETVNGTGEFARDLFSLRGREVTGVHIYVTQKEKNMFELVTAKTEKQAKKKSEYDITVDIP